VSLNNNSTTTIRRRLTRKEQPQDDSFFSACLLNMDENHFLIEWLAYHYHVLRLRHVIVMSDPRAKTSPQPIFDRWKGKMNIEVWKPDGILSKRLEKYLSKKKLMTFRERQKKFRFLCMQAFKDRGHKWVLHTDVDEYISLNHRDPKVSGIDPAYKYPSLEEEGSVLKFINDNPNSSLMQEGPCVPIPRRQYNAKASTKQQVQKDVPEPFNGMDFLTTRYRKWFARKSWHSPKVMVDLTKVNIKMDYNPPAVVHHPLPECRNDTQAMPLDVSDFTLSHFLGTWEQFSYKDDARLYGAKYMKDRSKYDLLGKSGGREDDSLRLWLKGFVENVGVQDAAMLLTDVGKLEPIPTESQR
jgi:hypothetical protein